MSSGAGRRPGYRTRARPTAVLTLVAALALSACREPPDGPEPDESLGRIVYGLNVDEIAAAGGCSTAAVRGLSEQILAVVNCAQPGIYAAVPTRPNLSLGSAVFPYLETPARDALVATLDAHPGTTMNVTSMLRSVVAQYLLYYWYQHGQCGITAAAAPGSSNHESGLALDVSNYSTWQTALETNSFTWYGSGDVVHFTYTGPGSVDLRADSVLAFQRLWNYNHPADQIAEDGAYGPQTGTRIGQSPQDGFAGVPPCAQQDAGGPADTGAGPLDNGAVDRATSSRDGGVTDSSVSGPPDADQTDASGPGGIVQSVGPACGCATGGGGGAGAAGVLALLAAVARLRRRR
jgi:MYXO-CTERM domain-containing protein